MKINADNFEHFIFGSYFLSAGGGFDSPSASLFVEHQLRKQALSVLPITSIANDDIVLPISFLGCTTIEMEKNHNVINLEQLVQAIQKTQKKRVAGLFPISVGGGVPFIPLFLSSHFNIPLLDADSTGRCFPELQMMSTNLASIPPKKAFATNFMGDIVTIECSRFPALERHARQIAISSGGACLIVPQILTGEEAKRGLIAGSLTKALTIGKIIEETHDLNAVMEYTGGRLVGVGGVILSTGLGLPPQFKRRIIIRDTSKERTWEIWMDNEFNMLFENGEMIAEVPDIITLCDPETAEPLTIGQLYLHANVAICAMPAPDVWYSEKGLALARSKRHAEGKIVLCGPSSSSLKRTA